MQKSLILFLVIILLLSACNVPRGANTTAIPTEDAVATQVALMLTEIPSASAVPPTATQALSATSPVVTATQSATATSTATATPQPTPSSEDPKFGLGEPDWQTSFESGKPFGAIDNGNTLIRQENGALLLTGVNANGWLGWSLTFSQQPKDFYLDGTFTTQTCSGNDQYGMIFRAPDTSAGYFFGVTCSGQYYLEANNFNDNGSEKRIVEQTSVPEILPGPNQTNRLGVMIKGDQIALYINGKRLQEITDASFTEKGYLGAFVASYETAGLTVLLEDIALWNLP